MESLIDWIKDTSSFDDVQEKLKQDCETLITLFFDKASDYEKEKFLTSYAEGVRYLEKSLILLNKLDTGLLSKEALDTFDLGAYCKDLKKVNNVMLSELARKKRNTITFLSAVKNK